MRTRALSNQSYGGQTVECSYHVRHSGGASHARENRTLMPTDLGQAPPQVRAARGELQCSWSADPIGLVCGSSKRRSSCRTSAVRGLPDPLGSPSGFPLYALPFYSAHPAYCACTSA